MNYDEHPSCQGCASKTKFVNLKDMDNFECNESCSCRYTTERSSKDQMMIALYDKGIVPKVGALRRVPDITSNNSCLSQK